MGMTWIMDREWKYDHCNRHIFPLFIALRHRYIWNTPIIGKANHLLPVVCERGSGCCDGCWRRGRSNRGAGRRANRSNRQGNRGRKPHIGLIVLVWGLLFQALAFFTFIFLLLSSVVGNVRRLVRAARSTGGARPKAGAISIGEDRVTSQSVTRRVKVMQHAYKGQRSSECTCENRGIHWVEILCYNDVCFYDGRLGVTCRHDITMTISKTFSTHAKQQIERKGEVDI